MSLLTSRIDKKSHIWAGIYWSLLYFSQKRPKTKFKAFQNQALTSVKRSDFYVKECITRKVAHPFFKSFWLVLKKLSIWQKDCALAYSFNKF